MINGTQLVTPLSLCPFCNSELGEGGSKGEGEGEREREGGGGRGRVCVFIDVKHCPKKWGECNIEKREPLATCTCVSSSNLI